MGGRREDDSRLAKLEIEVSKLADHLDEVDDHLRGVAGHDSLDTRVTVLEKEFQMHGALLRRISDQFSGLHTMIDGMKHALSKIEISREIGGEVEKTRVDRLKEWLRFWAPIIALILTIAFDNREMFRPDPKYRPDARLRKQIEADKRSQRAKMVKKKLEALEAARKD